MNDISYKFYWLSSFSQKIGVLVRRNLWWEILYVFIGVYPYRFGLKIHRNFKWNFMRSRRGRRGCSRWWGPFFTRFVQSRDFFDGYFFSLSPQITSGYFWEQFDSWRVQVEKLRDLFFRQIEFGPPFVEIDNRYGIRIRDHGANHLFGHVIIDDGDLHPGVLSNSACTSFVYIKTVQIMTYSNYVRARSRWKCQSCHHDVWHCRQCNVLYQTPPRRKSEVSCRLHLSRS